MGKTYIGPQADADVGPISLAPSAHSRAAVGALAGRNLDDPVTSMTHKSETIVIHANMSCTNPMLLQDTLCS